MNLPENRYPQRYGADDAPPSNNVVRQLIDPLLPPAMVSRPAPRTDDSAPDTPPLPQQR